MSQDLDKVGALLLEVRRQFSRVENELIHNIEDIRDESKPMGRSKYDSIYDTIEQMNRQLNEIKNKKAWINEIWGEITNQIDRQLPERLETASRELNKNRTRFGLQGLVKSQINKRTVDDETAREILDRPYTETPMPTQGGRKTRRKHNRRKGRKSRSNKRH